MIFSSKFGFILETVFSYRWLRGANASREPIDSTLYITLKCWPRQFENNFSDICHSINAMIFALKRLENDYNNEPLCHEKKSEYLLKKVNKFPNSFL